MSATRPLDPPASASACWDAALAASDRRRAAGLLQVAAWDLLSVYLNGGLGRGALGFPLVCTEAPLLVRRAADLAELWRRYGEVFGVAALTGGYPDAASVLAAHYRRFAAEHDVHAAQDHTRVSVDPTRDHSSRPLQRHLPRPAAAHLHSFWLHGSSGDGHWKPGWSDVDTLAIVADGALRDPARLRELRRDLIAQRSVLLREQPFQLHGHFVLAESDLASLPSPMFPAVLFAHARAVTCAGGQFTVCERPAPDLARRALWHHGIHDLVAQADRPATGNLDRVFLLHRIYLLPSLYAQASGRAVPKREAFARLTDVVPDWSTEFFQRASEVWNHWTPPPAWHGLIRTTARPLSFNPFLYQRALRLLTARLAFFAAPPGGGWNALAAEAGQVAARLWRELPAGKVDHVDR